jgi:hypothetical protein
VTGHQALGVTRTIRDENSAAAPRTRNATEGVAIGAAVAGKLVELTRNVAAQTFTVAYAGEFCGQLAHEAGRGVRLTTSRSGQAPLMLMDILIAIVIVVIAGALGLVVHPLLWFIVVLAIIWLFARRSSWSRR